MSETNNSRYPEAYGAWAGNPKGQRPDYTRCCEEVTVYQGRWPKYTQCSNKRGKGPDQAYCGKHDPAAVAVRREKADARYTAKVNEERFKIHGKKFFLTLQKIAEGYNDSRGLACTVVDEFLKGQR